MLSLIFGAILNFKRKKYKVEILVKTDAVANQLACMDGQS
jgi:hypothetical protein